MAAPVSSSGAGVERSAATTSDVIRLGTLDHGSVAVVRPGTVIEIEGARVRWWLRGDDRWHDPGASASLREGRIDGVAAVESMIRSGSGDVTAVAAATVSGAGADRTSLPVVVLQVHNPTPSPVAVAFVLESGRSVTGDRLGVDDGVVRVQVARPARAIVSGADTASLFDLVSGSDPQDVVEFTGAGVGAVILPVPHTASATAVISCGPARVDRPDAVASLAEQVGSGASRVTSGWLAMVGRAPVLDWGDPAQLERWRASVTEALLGPLTPGTADLLDAVVALARCGLLDEADPWVDRLLGRQRTNGSVEGEDPLAATLGLLHAARALWVGGLETVAAQQLLGPVANAIEWLTARRRRSQWEAVGEQVADGFAAIVPVLTALGQPELAEELARDAGRLGWTGGGSSLPAWESAGAHTVGGQLDAVVAETATGLDLGRGWSAGMAGRPLVMQGVPTRWGRVSWALRWHGARPAMLWESEPWPDRDAVTGPRWRATGLDADWHGSGDTGEALLADPGGAGPEGGQLS